MARLIEIGSAEGVRSLVLRVGDLIMFSATGGRVRAGEDSVALLGPFQVGILGTDGRIHSPEGPPGRVAFRALRPGRAEIELVRGDPLSRPRATTLTLTIE